MACRPRAGAPAAGSSPNASQDKILCSRETSAYIGAMLGNLYKTQECSAARALEVVGERWSLLILRDALFRGYTRFGDFERSLEIAPNILAKRLEGFVAAVVSRCRTRPPGSWN